MAKKLKIYERLLIGAALALDVLDELYKGGVMAYRRESFDPWAPPDYNSFRLTKMISRLFHTGYMEKIIKNGKPYLRLTSKARDSLKRDFSLFRQQNRSWDGKWRLVIFDIKEKERYLRDMLREKLVELGFGRLQKSIYLSPFDFNQDLAEFFQAEGILGRAFVLAAKHELMGDPKDLANLVWQLTDLNEEYESLWREIQELKGGLKSGEAVKEIKNKYLELIIKDPCLPWDLLPADWLGESVKKAIIQL